MVAHRHLWMDAARGGAILLVLLDHATAMLTIHGVPVPSELALFADALSPYRMPLLMYLSGLLLQRSLSKPWKQFASGKLRNIGWPYLVWSVITLAATTGITLHALLRIPLISPTFLWFLWFILAYYGIGWVCDRLRLDPLLIAVTALVASAFLPDYARMSRFAFLLFFFMLGHAVMTRPARSALFSDPGPARRVLMLVCLISVLVSSGLALTGHDVRYGAAYVFGPLGVIVLLQAFSGRYRTSRVMRPLEYIGRNSLIFYVVHYAISWIVVGTAISLGFTSGRVLFLMAFGFALAAGVCFCHSRDRWEHIGWLFAFPVRASAAGVRQTLK